jgi:hypothetical protein
MITSFPSSSSSSSSGAPGAQRDREALEALVRLGFCDAAKVAREQGHERVLAAVAYARSRRNVNKPGAYVRRLLNGACIPAPLVWPDEEQRDGWRDWRSLDGHQPEEVWTEEPEAGGAAFWVLCLAALEGQVTRPNYDTWLSGTVGLSLRDDEMVVGAGSAFAVGWLSGKMKAVASKTASALLGRMTEVEFVLFEGGSYGDEAHRGGDVGDDRDGELGQQASG